MYFKGRKLLIATRHGKENVIAPILQQALDVICVPGNNFDTDQLGTFTGEVERTLPPLETARQKCLQAMQMYNMDLCVASEGSFGPHPELYFVPADEELLFFIDTKNDIEVWVRHLSTSTNFSSAEINTKHGLDDFAEQANFPSHALILKAPGEKPADVQKGITGYDELYQQFTSLVKKYGIVQVETDMRAMYNPLRMQVIKETAQKLAEKLQSVCSKCGAPGFGITAAEPGLPCNLCGLPTRSVLFYLYQCNRCGHAVKQQRPDGRKSEEPLYCDFCNP